jgi:hypothetical protein
MYFSPFMMMLLLLLLLPLPLLPNLCTGDHASANQASECIRLLDADGDGRIGLMDYIQFAAR